MTLKRLFLCSFSMLILVSTAWAEEEHATHGAHQHPETTATSWALGLDEKLGETVPLDLTFTDEAGEPVILRELIDGPTILSLVYYTCPNVCPRILGSVAQLLGRLNPEAGEPLNVITLSFDETDTPTVARQRKKNFLKAIGKPFPEERWHFLTGDPTAIRRLTDAVGFNFQRQGEAFEHPAALMVLSPSGKVVRYLYGLTYLPFDVKMALTEASEGRVGPTIRRALLFCFSYDPEGRTYVFNILKVTASVIIFFALVLLAVLVGKGRLSGREAG